MKTKEDFEREIQEKVDCLMQRGQAKKADMEMVIASVEAPKPQVASSLVNLERCVKNAFARKSMLLKENETTLLGEIHSLERSYDIIVDDQTVPYKQVVENINRALALITVDDPGSLEADSLASHTMVCNDLDELLNEVLDRIDAEVTECAKEAVMNAEFHPVGDGQSMDLGIVKTKKKMKVVRQVQLPYLLEGLAALSEDTVKVGYGTWRSGSDVYRVKECDDDDEFGFTEADDEVEFECDDDDEFRFTEADDKEDFEWDDDDYECDDVRYKKPDIGEVWDIAKLSYGQSAVSHGVETVTVYNFEDKPTHSKYRCISVAYACQICSDQNDRVYVVNGKPDIVVLQVGHTVNSQRIIRTGDIHPRQVAVTSSGVIIVSTCDITPSTVTVFGKNGALGSSIKAADENECLYATVDAKDQVLIARVRQGSKALKMTLYTLLGTTLKEKVTFEDTELRLEVYNALGSIGHLVSLTPELFAFAHYDSLTFLKVPF
eukprot:XP_011670817.1 PREDICTED: uncharacterized protein LOC105441419 [Strongylocentrotus purpuratus]